MEKEEARSFPRFINERICIRKKKKKYYKVAEEKMQNKI